MRRLLPAPNSVMGTPSASAHSKLACKSVRCCGATNNSAGPPTLTDVNVDRETRGLIKQLLPGRRMGCGELPRGENQDECVSVTDGLGTLAGG